MPSGTGKYRSLEERDGTLMSVVDFGGMHKDVCLEYIPDAAVGDYVVVHVGFAIQRLDEESAMRTLAEFEHLGVLKEEFGDGFELAAKQAGLRQPQRDATDDRGEVMKYLDEFSDPRAGAAICSTRSTRPPASAGRSWKSVAGRRIRSSGTASTSCCRSRSR